MFAEIEDTITRVLREKLVEIPKDHIAINAWPNKPPAVRILNLKFKLQKGDIGENRDMGKVEIDEKFDSDGAKTSFRLQEKPLKNSVRVESPPGILLCEKDDYEIEYAHDSINLHEAAEKGKNKILVKYCSQNSIMNLKSLKLRALYCFDVWGSDRVEADSLAEQVLKTLVTAEEQFLSIDLEMRPVGGAFLPEEEQKIRLKYVLEKEIRIEQIIGPMEKIEIKSKNL